MAAIVRSQLKMYAFFRSRFSSFPHRKVVSRATEKTTEGCKSEGIDE